MGCSTPGLPVHHQLPDFTQTHIHQVSDAIQPSRPLSPPSIFPSIKVFSNESALHIMWPKYWSFNFNISPSNEHSTQKMKKAFNSYSTVPWKVQCISWHTGAGVEWRGKESDWLEEAVEVGDGRAEGWSAIGDRGWAAMSLMPDTDGMHIRIFESLQLERLVCRGLTVVGQPMCFSALWDVTVSQRSPLDEERSRLSSLCLFPSLASPWSLSTPWGANSPLQSVATCNSFSVREESAPRPCGVPVTSFVFAESIKLKLQYFGHLMWRVTSLEETLMLGKIEGRKRRGDRGWDGWMASLTQWAWVWVNSGRWWRTERPGVLQSMGPQRVGHNWLNKNTSFMSLKV